MTKRTKKVGPAGRFQSRYGVRARNRLRNVEVIQRRKHVCPSCKQIAVKREGTGVYRCRKCGIKFAGGSYIPKTDGGLQVEKIIRGEIASSQPMDEPIQESEEE
jgi:large subunit ribosomal protein L37Ae